MTRLTKSIAFGLCIGIGGWARGYVRGSEHHLKNMSDDFIFYLLFGLAGAAVIYIVEPIYRLIKRIILRNKEPLDKTFIDFWD